MAASVLVDAGFACAGTNGKSKLLTKFFGNAHKREFNGRIEYQWRY